MQKESAKKLKTVEFYRKVMFLITFGSTTGCNMSPFHTSAGGPGQKKTESLLAIGQNSELLSLKHTLLGDIKPAPTPIGAGGGVHIRHCYPYARRRSPDRCEHTIAIPATPFFLKHAFAKYITGSGYRQT